jgi:CRP-like cAMP-binding protein
VENLERVLRQQELLKHLSPEEAALIVSCAANRRFGPGDFLFREGAPADRFFLVRRGRVALESHVPGRGPLQMESLGPGDLAGLSWVLAPFRYHLDARATEPTVALAFDAACLRGKMEADPHLGFALSKRLLAESIKRLERVRLQRLDVYGAR